MKKIVLVLALVFSTLATVAQTYKFNAIAFQHYQSENHQEMFNDSGDFVFVEDPEVELNVKDDIFRMIDNYELQLYGVDMSNTFEDTMSFDLDNMTYKFSSADSTIKFKECKIEYVTKDGKYLWLTVEEKQFHYVINTDPQPEDKFSVIVYGKFHKGFNKEPGVYTWAAICTDVSKWVLTVEK